MYMIYQIWVVWSFMICLQVDIRYVSDVRVGVIGVFFWNVVFYFCGYFSIFIVRLVLIK